MELRNKPDYKLVVTGHSLGAGTAVLVTLELLLGEDHLSRDLDIQCIALAPPPGRSPLRHPGQVGLTNWDPDTS